MRFSRNFTAVARIVDDQIGVAPGLDRSFAREQAEDSRRLRARGVDELMEIDSATFNAVGEKKIDPVLEVYGMPLGILVKSWRPMIFCVAKSKGA